MDYACLSFSHHNPLGPPGNQPTNNSTIQVAESSRVESNQISTILWLGHWGCSSSSSMSIPSSQQFLLMCCCAAVLLAKWKGSDVDQINLKKCGGKFPLLQETPVPLVCAFYTFLILISLSVKKS